MSAASKPPIHPMFPTVWHWWNVGIQDPVTHEVKPLRLYKTIARLSGVALSTVKEWQSKGYLDPKVEDQPTDWDAIAASSVGESIPSLEEDGRPAHLRRNAVQDSVAASRGGGAVEGERGMGVGATGVLADGLGGTLHGKALFRRDRKQIELREHTKDGPNVMPLSVDVRSQGFYQNAEVWLEDLAEMSRRVASKALSQLEGLIDGGYVGSASAKNALAITKETFVIAEDLAAKTAKPDVARAGETAGNDERRAKLRRRMEQNMAEARRLEELEAQMSEATRKAAN